VKIEAILLQKKFKLSN